MNARAIGTVLFLLGIGLTAWASHEIKALAP